MNFTNFNKAMKPYSMSILSVFISVLSFTVVSIISTAGKDAIAKELDGVGMNGMSVSLQNGAGENTTNLSLYDALAECEHITRLTPVIYENAVINFNTGKEISSLCWGISSTAKEVVNLEQLRGSNFTEQDITNGNLVCMIDENIAVNAYGRSNITGKDLYINTAAGVFKFEIIGIVNKTSNILNSMSGKNIPDFIYIPYTTMQNVFSRQGIDQIIINVTDDKITENLISNYINDNVKLPSDNILEITNLSRQRETFSRIVDIAFLALFAVSCVAVVVCGISVATSASALVNNSKHDIGIKISMGASVWDIMCEFMVYSLVACVIGIFLGLGSGYIALKAVNYITGSAYSFDVLLISYGVSATILLAMVFSVFPSYKAAHLLPVKALSRE
ncbi:MAG: ABC transporter permease [Clostridia bacterium]|nr:ABC transporter permease [Clostridia bacterium]